MEIVEMGISPSCRARHDGLIPISRWGAAELMPKKVTPEQRQAVLQLLAHGQDRDTMSVAVGVTPGQVSAIAAHVKMRTNTKSIKRES
jgi:hypothetical protein